MTKPIMVQLHHTLTIQDESRHGPVLAQQSPTLETFLPGQTCMNLYLLPAHRGSVGLYTGASHADMESRESPRGWSCVVVESSSSPLRGPISLFRASQLLTQPPKLSKSGDNNISLSLGPCIPPPPTPPPVGPHMELLRGAGRGTANLTYMSLQCLGRHLGTQHRGSLCFGGQAALGGECHQLTRCLGVYTIKPLLHSNNPPPQHIFPFQNSLAVP
jgi:hypothetical protein